jgi:hypothetical protein
VRVSKHIHKLIIHKLDTARIVVWYDGECAFGNFIQDFSAPNCRVVAVVSPQESRLRARREADVIYCQLNVSSSLRDSSANLLIYLPFKRSTGDARLQDPFEIFAVAGTTFGDTESEQLASLAYQALPDLTDQIERLFQEGRPTLEMLDQLERGASYPLVKQALGTQSAVEVAAQLLGDPQAPQKVADTPGCGKEILRLLEAELGFVPPANAKQWKQRWTLLARYVLFSEFAFDLPDELPASLANLPRAAESYRDQIYTVAERLRDTVSTCDAYIDLANNIERELGLATHFADITRLGQRDTFAFEERQYLVALAQVLETEQLNAAREIIASQARSVWRGEPERTQVWRVAERCVTLLDVAQQVERAWEQEADHVDRIIAAYTREDGWSELDRHQRLMEQSVAECTECEELEAVIRHCQARYREVVDAIQQRFLEAIQETGWPPDSILRQTQVFDRFVGPALAAREKVAYFLADALRFEMGRDLAGALSTLGEIDLQPVASALPTITSVGMAALMPGTDGTLTMRSVGDDLIPYLGEYCLRTSADRVKLLAEKYGDRFMDVEISEFLSLTSVSKQKARLKNADLVVVRDSRIDRMGETITLREARKYMTDLLGDLKAAITQLVRLGYDYFVIVTDHGHVLLPEVLPGDVVPESPIGEWPLKKRRSLLGRQIKASKGTTVLNAAHVGIQGDAAELVVPNGFGVYSAGSGYFHGGLSLQECVLPLITLRAKDHPTEQAGYELEIHYRSDTFTSRVIGLKVWFNSMFEKSIRVRIEAFDGSDPFARQIGEAADCDARDEVTHEVTLTAGQDTPVPVLLDPDFDGDQIEIRATNPDAPVVWKRLTLKNGVMD